MNHAIALLALGFLMLVAYRGFSVILFAPVAALLAVLLTDPSAVLPVFSGLFMEKMVGFVKLYLPVFLLGAVFGKVIELSGFSRSIVTAVIDLVGPRRAVLSIVLVLQSAHLWRRLALRRGVRGLSVRGGSLPAERDPEAPHPRHHRARRLLLHDGRAARHAADPEHHSHHLLRHQHLGGPLARADRRRLHPRRGRRLSRPAHRLGQGQGRGLRQRPQQ